MKIKIDENCPTCKGRGEIMETTGPYNETYITFMTCHCVTYEHTEQEKEFLRKRIDTNPSS